METTDKRSQSGENILSFADAKQNRLFAFNQATYGDVIRKYRMRRNLTQPQLAKLIGTRKNYVSNWEKGKARPDMNIVPALCDALGISISAFFSKPMLPDELSHEDKTLLENYHSLSYNNRQAVGSLITTMLDIEARHMRSYCENSFEKVWHDDLKVSAGSGNPLDEGGHGEYVYLRSSHTTCRADAIITVAGDSMEPTYHDGDNLLVEFAETLNPGDVGVFIADGEGFVKEYQQDGLHPHNPEYPVLKFSADDDLRCIARVIGVVEQSAYPTAAEAIELDDIEADRQRKKR
jgi:repressor LexA